MIRKAFVMRVFAGCEEEYHKRHRRIWPEVVDMLHAHGVSNYSIHLQPGTGCLFAYAEIESEEAWAAIAGTPECQRWWKHMADVMECNPDQSPRAEPLVEMFHMP